MVDGADCALVETRLLGCLEVRNVPDVGDGVAVDRGADVGAGAAYLVVLVVEDQVLLPLLVEDSALVGVLDARVAGDRDDQGLGLVGDVVDGQRVLVVAVADVAAVVARVGATVDEALSLRGGLARQR